MPNTRWYRSSQNCIFSQRFTGPAEVTDAGGTLTGSPVFRDGLVLDGVNQNAVFPVTTEFSRPIVTIKLVFTPAFDWDADVQQYLFDTNGPRYYALKLNNASSNVLQVFYGDGGFNIDAVDYSSYWKVNEKNTLLITYNGTTVYTYLNNNLVMSSGETKSADAPSLMVVGSRWSSQSFFSGTIHEFSIFDGAWTDQEVADDYHGTTFDYQNKADLWLDMATSTSRNGLDVTLDKSVNNHIVTLGDGAGTGAPTFKNPGFEFDGINDYLDLDTNPLNGATSFSFVAAFRLSTTAEQWVIDFNSSPFLSLRLNDGAGNLDIIGYDGAVKTAASSGHNFNQLCVVIGTITQNDFVCSYFNGELQDETAIGTLAALGTDQAIGAKGDKLSRFVGGSIYHCSLYPFKMSELQVKELTQQLMSKYGAL